MRKIAISITGSVVMFLAGCGDDGSPSPDDGGSSVSDAAADGDSGSAVGDDSGTDTDAGSGGSTVGMICANDDNCTGDGEICCLESTPYVCRLAADCDTTTGGIPCDTSDDCPSSRVCCSLPSDQFCTTRSACEDYGGEEV